MDRATIPYPFPSAGGCRVASIGRGAPCFFGGSVRAGHGDAVYGSRFLGRGRQATGPVHRAANWLLTWLSNQFTGLRLTDMETGQKAFRREAIATLSLVEDRYGIEPEITAKLTRQGFRIVEVPVSYRGRSHAAGKKIGFRDGLRALGCIVRYSR